MVTIKDALVELYRNKEEYEKMAKSPNRLDAGYLKDPIKNAAYGLLLTSKTSDNPERFLNTLSPFFDSKIKFDYKTQRGVLGETKPAQPEATVYTTDDRGVALHELVHTLQAKQVRDKDPYTDFQRDVGNKVFSKAKQLEKEGLIKFPASNWSNNIPELNANVYDISRQYEEAGQDFTKTQAFNLLYPDQESKLYYYTQILPKTSVAYPGSDTFVPERQVDRNKSYARQAYDYFEDILSNPFSKGL